MLNFTRPSVFRPSAAEPPHHAAISQYTASNLAYTSQRKVPPWHEGVFRALLHPDRPPEALPMIAFQPATLAPSALAPSDHA